MPDDNHGREPAGKKDEWKAGDLICISRGLLIEHVMHNCGETENFLSEDRQFNGWPLRVVGVSMPFLAIDVLTQEMPNERRKIIDTRLYELTRITKEYAEAMIPGGILPVSDQVEKQMAFPAKLFLISKN